MEKTRFKIQCPYCDFLGPVVLEPHGEPLAGEFVGDDSYVDEITGFGHYIYICPHCEKRFILEDNREYLILDKEFKNSILDKIKYADDWSREDLCVVVNVYKLVP